MSEAPKKPVVFNFLAVDFIGDSFLKIARHFREALDATPEQFADIAKLSGVSLRRAYYLAKIDRTFRELNIDEGRLLSIGWTKLQLIADHIDDGNCEALLELAESSTVRELSLMMKDQVPLEGTRCVILYLEPEQYEVFRKAILAHGGIMGGRGMSGKEEALIKALAKDL